MAPRPRARRPGTGAIDPPRPSRRVDRTEWPFAGCSLWRHGLACRPGTDQLVQLARDERLAFHRLCLGPSDHGAARVRALLCRKTDLFAACRRDLRGATGSTTPCPIAIPPHKPDYRRM